MGFFSFMCHVFSTIYTLFTYVFKTIQDTSDYVDETNKNINRNRAYSTNAQCVDSTHHGFSDKLYFQSNATPFRKYSEWLQMGKLEEFTMPASIFHIERYENDSMDSGEMIG